MLFLVEILAHKILPLQSREAIKIKLDNKIIKNVVNGKKLIVKKSIHRFSPFYIGAKKYKEKYNIW